MSAAAARPIVIIGAGTIVHDAHLPAYRKAGFAVAGIFDRAREKAEALARQFAISRVYDSLEAAGREAPPQAVFDVAVPAAALLDVVAGLPDGRCVLLQKPFGESLEEAERLTALCRRKRLRAAVNFQLRYAPNMLGARQLIAAGEIGELHAMEARVNVFMPWQLWSFLARHPRVEMLYHSIHYLDLFRSFLGEPRGVYAKTARHPASPGMSATRSAIILDYGDDVLATITASHGNRFGGGQQESFIRWEGTRGMMAARMGVNLNYPAGEPDTLGYGTLDEGGRPAWREVPLAGNWFPDAFIGSMASLMRWAEHPDQPAATNIEDAGKTMALVEAAYAASAAGGHAIRPVAASSEAGHTTGHGADHGTAHH